VRSIINRLAPYIKIFKGKIILSMSLGVLMAGIKALQIYLVKPIFDKGFSPNSTWTDIIWLVAALLTLSLLFFPARFFHFYVIRFVVDRATCCIRSDVYKRMQRLPMKFFSQSKQGNLMSLLTNDCLVFANGLRNVIDLIREPLTFLAMLGQAFYHDWALALIIIAVLPFFALIFIVSGKKVKKSQHRVQEEIADVTHSIHEGLAGHKIAKAFNLQNYIFRRFEKRQDHFFDAQMKTTFVEEMAHPLVEVVGAVAFAGAIIFAYYRISTGVLTTGSFIAFVACLALAMDPIRKFSQANVKLGQAHASGDRLIALLNQPEEVDQGTVEIKNFSSEILVNNLTFSYGEGDVLKNFSMRVKKGEKVALVGLSGSGKSTMINLLLGLYPVRPNSITIDGHSVENIKLSSLRNLFGLVSQDIFLFHDTVAENLTVGNDYTKEAIAKALTVSYAAEFVDKLPKGEMTMIGDRGTRLSGGQQQRLTIGRAFLKDSDVLLFDEATSALDNESEKVVQQALASIGSVKTVIAVAHRLSTIQDYDRIYVLKEGLLVEEGNHSYLMSKGGEYAKLYELSKKA